MAYVWSLDSSRLPFLGDREMHHRLGMQQDRLRCPACIITVVLRTGCCYI
jgi:hypothetical protein